MSRRKLTDAERRERKPFQPGTKEKVLADIERYLTHPDEPMVSNGLAGKLEATKGMNVSPSKMFEDGGHKLAVVRYMAARAALVEVPASREEVYEYLEEFLTFCGDNQVPPTIGGFAVWCGVTVNRINQIERDKSDPDRARAFSSAKEVIRNFLEVSAMDATINPIVYFHQNKVYYGAVENQVVTHRVDDNTSEIDEEEYQRRVIQLVKGDDGGYHQVPENGPEKL